MKFKSKFKLWFPVLIWCVVIFSFSSMRINKIKDFTWLDFIFKKTAHVVEYAVLFYLTFRAASDKGKKHTAKIIAFSIIFSLLYAFSDEWHQSFTPGREATLRDVGFDTIGILLSYTQIKRFK